MPGRKIRGSGWSGSRAQCAVSWVQSNQFVGSNELNFGQKPKISALRGNPDVLNWKGLEKRSEEKTHDVGGDGIGSTPSGCCYPHH